MSHVTTAAIAKSANRTSQAIRNRAKRLRIKPAIIAGPVWLWHSTDARKLAKSGGK